jgi:glycerol-3-phosphate acyltransferase PlsX
MIASGDSTIVVDAMGSDMGPLEVLHGVALAYRSEKVDIPIILTGQEEVLKPLLTQTGLDKDSRVSIYHASEVIGMDEKPVQSLKQKKDSSLLRGIELVKAGKARAFVSCGNTGSLMAGGTLRLRPLQGLERPALATVVPSKDHYAVLVDVGANPESEPKHLVHNAVLGSIYAQIALGIEKPRVGLLSIGTEEGKGTEGIHQAHALLKKCQGLIHYTGLMEGFQVFDNHVDVVVCDGFVGNILLKTCEGLYKTLKGMAKTELTRNPLRAIGALMARGAFRDLKRKLDPDRYAGAPLLGIRGTILKTHGSSNRWAIASAVRIASQVVRQDMNHRIEEQVARVNQLLKSDTDKEPQVLPVTTEVE